MISSTVFCLKPSAQYTAILRATIRLHHGELTPRIRGMKPIIMENQFSLF